MSDIIMDKEEIQEGIFEHSHKEIKGLKIADPHFVFRGLTYGQWAAVWMNQLFSDSPETGYSSGKGKDVVFLRGNIEYGYKQDPEHSTYSTITLENRLRIMQDTAVFVPVITTEFVLDDIYQGQIMKDEITMRNTARRDTVESGNIGVRIKEAGKRSEIAHALVPDLNDYYVESPLFQLSVSEKNPYKHIKEFTYDPGIYHMVVTGIVVIISNWPEGVIRLSVSGRGVGTYLTKSVYDIEVSSGESKLADISHPGRFPTAGLPTDDPMDFMPSWKWRPKTEFELKPE
jgi:hypothetical protein